MEGVVESVVVGGVVEADLAYIKSYLVDAGLRRLSGGTVRGYESNLKIMAGYLHRHGVSILGLDKHGLRDVLGFLVSERGVSEKSLNNYFCALSSFYDYLCYENVVKSNPVPSFRKRYLKNYKKSRPAPCRKLISVEEASRLINSAISIRDKTLMAVLAKTGVRRGELISMDVDDVDWHYQRIKLKPKNKRSNLYVYFDEEVAILLNRWLKVRESYARRGVKALFVGDLGARIGRNIVYNIVTEHAARVGLHKPESDRLEDHFSPHNFRHWFTTHLRRNGMNREFIKELRGDSRGDAIDIYDHIDHQELRKAYLASIPRLGII